MSFLQLDDIIWKMCRVLPWMIGFIKGFVKIQSTSINSVYRILPFFFFLSFNNIYYILLTWKYLILSIRFGCNICTEPKKPNYQDFLRDNKTNCWIAFTLALTALLNPHYSPQNKTLPYNKPNLAYACHYLHTSASYTSFINFLIRISLIDKILMSFIFY